MGVKNLQNLNLALLGKWRWRLLRESEGLWYRVLKVRYGQGSSFREAQGRDSTWWRDLWRLEGRDSSNEGWLTRGIVRKLGNGREICFWEDCWLGGAKLRDMFSRLYNASTNKEGRLSDLGFWREGNWSWNLQWRRRFFLWEEQILVDLMQVISQCSVHEDRPDSWCWDYDPSGDYSVKSAYRCISKVEESSDSMFYMSLWDNITPLRVAAFCWKASLDRIPSAENLIRRGIQVNVSNLDCHFCNSAREETAHILMSCTFSYRMWMQVYNWLGVVTVLPQDLKAHLLQHSGMIHQKAYASCWQLVWAATVWSLWLHRNVLFNNRGLEFDKVFELIRVRAWNWCSKMVKGSKFSFIDWCTHPVICLQYCNSKVSWRI